MKFTSLASLLFLPVILSRKYSIHSFSIICIPNKFRFWSKIHQQIFYLYFQEDVKFGDNEDSQDSQTKIQEGSEGANGEITEEDVNERFINLDLGDFGNNVCAIRILGKHDLTLLKTMKM